ncbi:MAG: 2-amino-4-hydroxy-6-hydroxymethyldihydropteridine diphosphokinase [Phycisphaeraceae bacterium]|nr:2-amino-4-hydroxy-6-hydroxymethyldihydropteridine diphosphokinase [Phycisphaeraceae bacterium]
MATVCIGIGSNLGDRAEIVRQAIESLRGLARVDASADEADGCRFVEGGVYETDPVGGPAGQDKYLNTAVRFETTLSPRQLIEQLLAIEQAAGRPQRSKRQVNGPRTLDLDLLLYDQQVIDEQGLTVPHPRMHEREFVLRPLCDVAGEMTHPLLGKTVHELFDDLKK